MAPLIGPHDLEVDSARQQLGAFPALDHMVEPLIAQVIEIDLRGRVDRVTPQHLRRIALQRRLVVRSDQESLIRAWVVARHLAEEVQSARCGAVVVAGHRQHRNADVRELLADRDHRLPEPVVTGMVQPAAEKTVLHAVQPVQVPIGLAAGVPVVVQRMPGTLIVAGRLRRPVAADHRQRPAVGRVVEDAAFHRSIDSRAGGGDGCDRFERGGRFLGRCPLRVGAVAGAIHSDTPVAPALLHDPCDHGTGIVAIVLVRDDRVRTLELAASVCDDADITVSSTFAGAILRGYHIGELEQRRQRLGGVSRAHDDRG